MEQFDRALGFAFRAPALDRAPQTEGTLTSARAACAAVRADLATWVSEIPVPDPLAFSREEVETLLRGTSVGGYSLEEEWQLINRARAWSRMLAWVEAGRFTLHSDVLVALNAILSRDADLRWGLDQRGVVPAGQVYRRQAEVMVGDARFGPGVEALERIGPTLQRAVGFYLFACLHQFVDVYNEATAWLMMNGVLLAGGKRPCRLSEDDHAEWNMRMMRFYDRRDGNEFFDWFSGVYDLGSAEAPLPRPD